MAIVLGIDTNTVTPYQLVNGWDSYVHDVEQNLKHDPESWKKYQRRPTPFLRDVLHDFGTFPKRLEGMTGDAYLKAISKIVDAALKNHGYT